MKRIHLREYIEDRKLRASLELMTWAALLKRAETGLTVTLPNVYQDAQSGAVDLAEVFIATHQYIEELIRNIIDALLEFYFQHDGAPTNNSYQPVCSPYGTMMVGLGPKGFTFSDFHEAKEPTKTLSPRRGLDDYYGDFPRAALCLPWAIIFRSDGAVVC